MSQSTLKRVMTSTRGAIADRDAAKPSSEIIEISSGLAIYKNRNKSKIFSENSINYDYMNERVSDVICILNSDIDRIQVLSHGSPAKLVDTILARVDEITAYDSIGGIRVAVEREIFRGILGALSSYQPNSEENQLSGDVGFDPKELESVTTFWADREKKTRGGRSAIEFLIEVYGEHGLGRGLNKAHIKRHDSKLYIALMNWARDDAKKHELDQILPQGLIKYADQSLSQQDEMELRRLTALRSRSRRASAI